MKRGLKLVVTWLFIVSVFAGFIPGTLPVSSAAASNELIWPNPGAVNLTKTAEPTGTQGQWKVTLTVEGKNIQSTSDVVLVIDRSGSMKDSSRMTNAKAAAKKFVDNLLIKDSKTRIAVVSFGEGVTTESDFTGTAGKESLKTNIDKINAAGGTNIQAGLNRARTLLGNSQAQNKVIVLLSDGEPTYSYKAGKATAYNWPENKFNFALSDFNYGTILGSGQDYGLSEGFLGWGREVYTVNGFDVKNNGIGTISEAKLAKDSGIGIYSIGLEVGGSTNAKYVLNNTQNKGYYESSSSDLSKVFTELSSKISYAAQNAKVIDPMGAKFDKIEGPTVSQGTTSWDSKTETITWEIGNIVEGSPATMSYIVKMDNDADPNVLYPTNKVTTMSYIDVNGKSTSKNFIVPEVSFGKGSITVRGYSVNAAGQPINADGVVVEKPELAEQLYNEPFIVNGKPALDINKTYSVPAGTVAGYHLTVGVDPTSVQLTTKVPTPTIWFGYVKAPYTLDVLHKVGDTVLEESKGIKKLQGEAIDYSSKEFAGYLFKNVVLSSNSGLTTEGGHVTGKMPNKDVTITFNYEAIAQNVTVKYLEKGSNKELIPATNEAGVTGKTITLTAAEIPGYTAEKVSDSYKFTALKGQEYTFFYTAGEQQVTVKYLEKDTNKVLATETILAGTTGKTVTLNAAAVTGYTAEKLTDNYTFTALKGQEYTFFYTAGEQKVTVKYVEKGTDKELAKEITVAGTTGKTITLEAAKVDGYTAEKASDSYTFKAGAGQEYTFYYTANSQAVTVKYLDKNDHTNILATETSVTGKTGETVTLNAVTVDGYTAEKASDSYTFKAVAGQEYTFYYTANAQAVTVKYLDKNDHTNVLATETSVTGTTGETITLNAVTVAGYTAEKASDSYTFKAVAGQEYTFYYTANSQAVTVKYLDKNNHTNVLATETSVTGTTGETVTLNAVTVDGYTAEKASDSYTFKAVASQEYTFYYTANAQAVTVKYLDKNDHTNVLATETSVTGTTGETVTLNAVTVDGYTAEKASDSYTFKAVAGQEYIFYYTANSQAVTVKYLDKNDHTNVLATETSVTGTSGETVTLNAVTVAGYTAEKASDSYIFKAVAGQEYTFYYTADSQEVTVKYLDKNDHTNVLATETSVTGTTGETVTINAATVAGYTAEKANDSYTFKAVAGQEYTFYYTKNAPNLERFVTVNYIDLVTNLPLIDPINREGVVGDILRAEPITVGDVEYTPDESNLDYVITDELKQSTNFYYILKNAVDQQQVTIKYLERDTDAELGVDDVVVFGQKGATITHIPPSQITVTDAVYTPESPTYSITFTGEPDQVFPIYYIKGGAPVDQYQQVTVKYLEQGTDKELRGSTKASGIVGSTISLTAISIPGYTAVKSTDTFQVGDNEGQEYTFYYTKNAPVTPVDPNPGTPSNPSTSNPTPLPPAPPVVAPLPPAPPTLEKENHYNYINGYPDGTIKPENRISREEVAAIFYRLMDDETRSSYLKNDSSYGDVEGSRWSNKHIATMENAGIITGYPDGTFKPARQITRAEFAAIASRFDNLDEQENTLFSDIKDHWAAKYIVSAANKGWIKGYPDGTFKPNQYITRAEAMAFINSVLNRKTRVPGIHEDAKAWPDNNIAKWYYTEVLEATNHHDYSRNEDGSETWTEVKSDRVYP